MRILQDYMGRAVRLTDERLAHILQHPEMAGMMGAIELTLSESETVIRSRSDSAVELIYRKQPQTMVGEKWLCVAVKYADDDAFLLTAYLTDRPKPGETLWPKK